MFCKGRGDIPASNEFYGTSRSGDLGYPYLDFVFNWDLDIISTGILHLLSLSSTRFQSGHHSWPRVFWNWNWIISEYIGGFLLLDCFFGAFFCLNLFTGLKFQVELETNSKTPNMFSTNLVGKHVCKNDLYSGEN